MRIVTLRDAGMRTCGLAIALAIVGCRPPEPPQFSRSAELQALSEFAEADDGESRKLWQGLQTQIEAELAQRCGTPLAPIVIGDAEADRTRLRRGADVFAYRCQQCHGVGGTGQSSLTQYLNPKPRDYTKGIFKFTSTPYNAKPRRSDLLRTVRRGVTGTSMPSFDDLDPEDLEAVVDYVVYLSQRGELEQELVLLAQDEEELADDLVQESVDTVRNRWTEAQSQLVMPVTPMPPMTAETIAKGRELYMQQVCNKCHGVDGRGGLAGNIEITKDAWGQETAAADLTSGLYRGGGRPIDIYRRIYSGINGTPMPGFAQTLANEPDNFWYLVHFIRDTGERRRRNLPPEAAPAQPVQPTTPTLPQPEVPAAEPAAAPETDPDISPDNNAADAAAAQSVNSIPSVPQS